METSVCFPYNSGCYLLLNLLECEGPEKAFAIITVTSGTGDSEACSGARLAQGHRVGSRPRSFHLQPLAFYFYVLVPLTT